MSDGGTDLDRRVEAGWRMFDEGREEEAIAHFARLAERYPGEPRACFELGSAFDAASRESEAIPLYRKALELGLPNEYEPKALLQLGSSLRNVGEPAEAVRVLRRGRGLYPAHAPLRFFLALALHAAGRHDEALHEALSLALSAPEGQETAEYARAMRRYADELRRSG